MRGHQLFADALGRRAPQLSQLTNQVSAPLQVGVLGRPGVGRGTVASALALAGLTVSGDGADVAVLVVAEVIKPEDRAVLAAAKVPIVMVLNKADLAGFGPGGPLAMAGAQAERLAAAARVRTRPLAGLLATAGLADGVVDDAMLAALRVIAEQPVDLRSPDSFVAGPHDVDVPTRRRLLERLDLFGIAHAVVALQHAPATGPGALRQVFRAVSGIDDVVSAIGRAGAGVRYRRVVAACEDLQVRAITDPEIADILVDADLVLARMAAAVDVLEADGVLVDPTDDPSAHLARAVRWQALADAPLADLHRQCAHDIVRGSLRLLDPGLAA